MIYEGSGGSGSPGLPQVDSVARAVVVRTRPGRTAMYLPCLTMEFGLHWEIHQSSSAPRFAVPGRGAR